MGCVSMKDRELTRARTSVRVATGEERILVTRRKPFGAGSLGANLDCCDPTCTYKRCQDTLYMVLH